MAGDEQATSRVGRFTLLASLLLFAILQPYVILSYFSIAPRKPATPQPLAAAALPLNGIAANPVVMDWDFGTVRTNDLVSHAFLLRNSSDIPWTIKEVRSDCSCAVPNVTKTTLPPGRAEEMLVQLRTNGHASEMVRRIRVEMFHRQ
jgi:hypothetical protein